MEDLKEKLDILLTEIRESLNKTPFKSLRIAFLIQLVLSLTFFIFKVKSFFLNLMPFLLTASVYIMTKNNIKNEKENKNSLLFAKSSFSILVLSIVNGFIFKIEKKMLSLNPNANSGGFIIILLVDIMVLSALLILFLSEFVKNKSLQFHEADIKTFFKKGGGEEEIKPGDAVIGYSIEDNKPVILPLNDRYLHMLVIGPTGSGKTSQSIIPMINRDMTNFDIGITVLEPKGDLAEKIDAMAKYYGRKVLYFNPTFPDCPYFNPLCGDETDVIENMATTFKMLNPDSSQFFLDMNENTTRKGLKVIKRLYGDDATLIHFDTLLNNAKQGKKMIMDFSKMPAKNLSIARENSDIAQWFLDDYYSGLSGQKGGTKTFEHCSGLRSQVAKLISNEYLRKVLNPPEGKSQSGINFDKALEEGIVLTMTTCQGTLRDMGKYLGYFLILQLQAAVFRRPGNEDTRRGNMLYIDEFQVYTTPSFSDMLTQGRSYRVASHLATQARDQIAMGGGKDGKNFVTVVDSNARNKIIYPGSFSDADFYSKQFGEIIEEEIKQTKAYSTYAGFKGIFSDKISESVASNKRARFRPEDIVFRPFGEITYCLIKNNSIQTPGVSKIQYIPRELNQTLNKMVEDFRKEQEEKAQRIAEEERLKYSSNKPKSNDNVIQLDGSSEEDDEDILEAMISGNSFANIPDENTINSEFNNDDNNNDSSQEDDSEEFMLNNMIGMLDVEEDDS